MRPTMRDAFGKRHHLTVGDGVHIDRAYDIPVAFKSTGLASPVPPFGLMTMATYGTPAGRTTFVPGEAWAMRPTMRDAVLFRLLLQIIDIPAVLPLAHALVVVAAGVLAADPVGVADEHGFHFMFLTKIHHLAGPLVAQVTDAALSAQSQLCACMSRFPPATGALLAAGALGLNLSELLAVVALQGADTAPGDNQRITLVGGHGGQMDLAQVHGGVLIGRLQQWHCFGVIGGADM